ncbi:MAG: carbohydrate ABC transporter permease [Clostridia bacterium]|nr:carbohydrate ABC transporter permease [Clostridia bacterium]
MDNNNVKIGAPTVKPKKNTLLLPHEKTGVQVVILTVIIFCLLFSFLPLLLTVINSLKIDVQVQTNAFALPEFSTMGEAIATNFSVAWGAIGQFYFKTILIALIGAVLETIVAAILAYILSFKDFYFKDLVFLFFIAVLLVPSIIGYPVLVPFVRDTLGFGGNYVGYLFAMIGGSQVSGMFLFKTFFSQQPKSLYESASLDGANDFVIFLKITIPLAFPIILYYFVGCFSGIYNEYLWASLILDNDHKTLTQIMFAVSGESVKYGAMYAMYILASIPLIATTIISMKYFKSGEFAAGLKL